MAEDFVEAMLEAPYKKGEETANSKHKENGVSSSHKSSSKSKHRDRDRSKSRERRHSSRDKERKRRSRSREKSRDRERDKRSRDRRSRSRDKKKRSKSRDRERERPRRKRSLTPLLLPGRKEPYVKYRKSPPVGVPPLDDLSPEERDARTIFCMQLSQRVRARDLEEFFSSVGKVRDVRLITCNKTRRFKGIAYIEFKDPESVPLIVLLCH